MEDNLAPNVDLSSKCLALRVPRIPVIGSKVDKYENVSE